MRQLLTLMAIAGLSLSIIGCSKPKPAAPPAAPPAETPPAEAPKE